MDVVYLEPFDTGSHAVFTRALTSAPFARWRPLTLPGRHWKWRMRSAAVWAALEHREVLTSADVLLASSFVPLAELVGLVPELGGRPRVLYFHENQLTYPTRVDDPRDLHYGVTQMVSALAATRCVFNSAYNRDSFLRAAAELVARMPKPRWPAWVEQIEAKSLVLPLPLEFEDEPMLQPQRSETRALGPIIGWNHRWEHDKDPDAFFTGLFALQAEGLPFRVVVLGESYRDVPAIFAQARERLGDRVLQFGYAKSAAEYRGWLSRCHIVVSTAQHEFFGISMLEATHHGALPVVPDRLAYRELFPPEYRCDDWVDRVRRAILAYVAGRDPLRANRRELTQPYQAANVWPRYQALFESLL